MAMDATSHVPVPNRVLVEHDGTWHHGTLNHSASSPDGTLTHLVTWRLPDGETRVDQLSASRVAMLGN